MKCSLAKQILRQSLSIPCTLIRLVEIHDIESNDNWFIEIVRGNKNTHDCIGIHLKNPDEREIEDAIETACRDLFQRIYIYK